jgi:mannose-1-phosphate guanylyltransferase
LTVERVEGLVGIANTYIVAGSEFKSIISEQIPHLPIENIIIEPFGRDTAAAIGLASLILGQKDPHEVMIVLPADHYIGNVPRFHEVLRSAVAAAGKTNSIVTLGITPNSPETGYGYIQRGDLLDHYAGIPVSHVSRFLEKPDYNRALEFLASGDYLWNSGMFIWRIDLILKMIGEHAPLLDSGLRNIGEYLGSDQYNDILEKVYSDLPKVSVDYGILEKADNVLVIPCGFAWDDIGCWTAIERYSDKDENGNIFMCEGVIMDTANTYVFSQDKPVAVLGVADLIVVNEKDSLLICHKRRAQEIKNIVRTLKDKGFEDLL